GRELAAAQAVARGGERQGGELGHSSGLSQANASAPGAECCALRSCFAVSSSCPTPPSGFFGGGRPSASKSSAETPGGISPRARKPAHHMRKKYSCSSQARHMVSSAFEIRGTRRTRARGWSNKPQRGSFDHLRHDKEMVFD